MHFVNGSNNWPRYVFNQDDLVFKTATVNPAQTTVRIALDFGAGKQLDECQLSVFLSYLQVSKVLYLAYPT